MQPYPRGRAMLMAGLSSLALAGAASAQDLAAAAPPGAAAVANTLVYDQAYIARFAVNNAEDVLRRIPGVSTILDNNTDQQERGFGSGGSQILLNGRRFPGKANEINTTLRRIPARNIERVELISGAASRINVQSQGIVVNIALREGAAVGGSGSWELNARLSADGRPDADGLVAYSKAFGGLTLGAGLERQAWAPASSGNGRWTERTRREVFFYPGGAVQELRPQTWTRYTDKWIATGSAAYQFANGDQASLNGLYEMNSFAEKALADIVRFSPAGAQTLSARELNQRRIEGSRTLELGGEYSASFGPGGFSGLFILRRELNPTLNFRNREEPTRFVEASRSESEVRTGEDILRMSYTTPLGAGRSFESGVEGARNTLRQSFEAFFDFDGDGRLEPARIPIADPRVKELRSEVFSTFKWQATPRLSLDASLNYEFSRLTTNYPGQPARQLGFVKPRLDLRYRPVPSRQVRVLIERTVSQLDFGNFVPSYNIVDDRVESGNPNLLPEQTWTFEAGYEQRLPNDGGLLEGRVFYEAITNAIDRIALTDPRGVLVTASGNIDKARRYGLEAKAGVRLGFVGLPDAQLTLRGLRQWTNVEDPFRREDRRLADDRGYAYDIGFRHDVQKWKGAYGFTYKSVGLNAINSDLFFTEYHSIDPTLEAFAERALTPKVVLRLELQNLTRSPERRYRLVYATNAIDGAPRRIDFYEERRDIRAAVRLRGRF